MMRRLLVVGLVLLLIVVVIVVLSLSAAVLIGWAYVLGTLITRVIPVETGQATLIALLGLITAVWLGGQIIRAFLPPSTGAIHFDDDDEWSEDEFDADEEEYDVDEEEPAHFSPSIPRWRQPLKTPRYAGTDRNAPCPCGSGRKYKNCHGRTTGAPST